MSELLLEGFGDAGQLIIEGYSDEGGQPVVVEAAPTFAPYRGGGDEGTWPDERDPASWLWGPPPQIPDRRRTRRTVSRPVPALPNPFDDVPLFETAAPEPPPSATALPAVEPPAVLPVEAQVDRHVELAAGLLGPSLDFWPLSVAKTLYAHREEGLEGLKEAAPEVVDEAAKAIGRHTMRELAYATLKGWLGKKK